MTDALKRPLDPGLVARVAAGIRYAATGRAPDWFGAGTPPTPVGPPEARGRAFDFPLAYNLQTTPRIGEGVGFEQLRALADSYDLLRLVIETRKDQMERLDWAIRPRLAAASHDDPRIAAATRLFAYPDGERPWHGWLRALLEDMLVIDAATIYPRPTLGGDLHALELIDGATIKRVLDDGGRTPAPPAPAYQQVLKGVVAGEFRRDELLYLPRNARTSKVYGYSPVEQIAMTVNIALRRQLVQLQHYTEGNTPEAIIGVPDGWTVDQIRQFQQYWDGLLSGNAAYRARTKFVPGGLTYQPTRELALKDEMDEWLARIVCFAFSIAPTALTRATNRSVAESVKATAFEEGLAPLMRWVKGVADLVLTRCLGAPDLEFWWLEGPSVSPMEQAQINQIYVSAGIKTAAEVRAELGLKPLPISPSPKE